MRRLLGGLVCMGLWCSTAWAADTWTFRIVEATKVGEQVQIIIDLYVNGVKYAGREVSLQTSELQGLTGAEIRTLLIAHAQVLKAQDDAEYQIRTRLQAVAGVDVAIP
jgi:hypothetical protein